MKDNMFTDVVILAGGFGERLWPASSSDFPKQFMSLEGGVSFLQSSILRAISLNITGHILIVTRKEIVNTVVEQTKNLLEQMGSMVSEDMKNRIIVIPEPCPIHTAAPVTISCHLLNHLDSNVNHSLLVMTSDHVIGPMDFFVADTELAYKAACKDKIVCYSIIPTEPSTGYGYIKTSTYVEGLENIESIKKIEEFKEKPDLETAKQYLASGNYTWNSGMFGFKSDVYLSELEKCEPEAFSVFSNLAKEKDFVFSNSDNIKILENWAGLDEMYKKAPRVSIDKALAEKTKEACTVKATFSWEDIGSWDSFEKLFTENQGKVATVDTENCFVYSDIPVALCGVKDLVVVVKNNKLLVMKKNCSPFVKDAVHILETDDNNK